MTSKRKPDGKIDWAARLLPPEERKTSWNWADAEMLLEAIVSVTEEGAALLLSKTSDGGALCLQVWDGTARHKFYPSSVTELNEMLESLKTTK